MIYKNLSISAGGGIIAHAQQAEQEECANICIGLGGTGIDCLREIKKQVHNRLKPDDENAEIPEYKHIQYLAIDTDESSLGDDNSISTLDTVTEFVSLSCKDIHAVIGNPRVLRQNPAQQWFSENISIQNAEAGAGGVRQVGRLLAIQNGDKIIRELTNKINSARTGLQDRPINIHIFTGMGGGTGSGCFLDICYILQYVLAQLSLSGQAQTCGYFFLPDVNLAKVNTETVRKYIEINGFAAMKELDYCMNFHVNGGEWSQSYNGFEVKTKQPPVKLAHLITAKDETGNIKANGYHYAMNVVVDYVMEFMTKQLVSEEDRKNGNFGLKSHISNFETTVTMLDKRRGARYYYCVLGASNAYMPYKDINSYVAARIYEAYGDLPRYNHDIDSFVADNGLSYSSMLNEINKGVRTIPMYEVDTKLLIDQVADITPDVIPNVLGQMRDALPKIQGDLAKNRESQIQSVIVDVQEKLIEYSKFANKGPIYASLILKNDKKEDCDLGNVVDGYITENNKNLSNARADLELSERTIATTLRELQNAKMKKSSKAKSYISAIHRFYSLKAKISLYKEMGDFLNEFKPQINRLYSDLFRPLIDVFDNIAETFKSNYTTLSENIRIDDDYALKIVGLDDESLVEALNTAVDAIDTKQVVIDFIGFMIDHKNSWLGKTNDAKISGVVSEFFVNQLSAFTNRNIDYYLQTKFNSKSQEELADAIYKNIIIRLKERAKPLFWADGSDGGIDEKSKMGYCSIPNTSDAIKAATEKLEQADNKIHMRNSIMQDRISMLIFYCGIPMFLFKGSFNYQAAYHTSTIVGKHLYEGTSQDGRNFRELHDIVPLSLLSEDQLTEKIKIFISEYQKAVKKKIIIKEPVGTDGRSFNYYIQFVDKEDHQSKMKKMQKLLDDGSTERINRFLDNDENTTVLFNDRYELPNTGAEGFKDDVVKDHVYASSFLRSMIREQLDLFAEFEAKKDELIDGSDEDKKYKNSLKSFADALCTGLITIENKYTFKYQKDDDGYIEERDLTTIDTEPFGAELPLYSAFVEFRKFDDEDRKEMDVTAKNRKLNEEDICSENTNKIKDYLDKRGDLIKEIATESYREYRKDICRFVDDLQKQVKIFYRSLI